MLSHSQSCDFGNVLRRTSRRINARGVPVLVGAVLLTAAALKAHQLATGYTTEDSSFTPRWFLIVLVEIELALGLLLWIGVYAKQARIAAVAAFAGFCFGALHQALSGASSCGCFGNIHINPWHTLLFDLLAVAVLWRWTPEVLEKTSQEERTRTTRSHILRSIAIGLLFLLAGIPAAIAMSSSRPPLLQCSDAAIDFGTMPQGERGEMTFLLTNPSQESVEIAKTESTCDCFHVDLALPAAAGGETIPVVARMELDKEPHFTGQLQIDIRGVTPSGAIAFSLRANARVVRK